MSWDLIIFVISLFAFIVSMIGTLGSFFGRRGKWFLPMLGCVLLSGACMGVELQRLLIPPPTHELPPVIRQLPL